MTAFASTSTPARVVHVATTGSTNEDALVRARTGEQGPLWLRADRQTTGRGRLGRDWASPVGNLHASLLLTSPARPRFFPQLAHVAAVALLEALHRTLGRDRLFVLKWPNDVLHGRAKVAGILVEATHNPDLQPVCVIGFGVNCAHHPDLPDYPTTDLGSVAKQPIAASDLFEALRTTVAESLTVWQGGVGYPRIRDAWLAGTFAIDTELVVRTGKDAVVGRFQGIDATGRLLLRSATGDVTIEAGDVYLSDGSAARAAEKVT